VRHFRGFSVLASGILVTLLASLLLACGAGPPRPRPQVRVEPSGERYPALPETARVRLWTKGEPQESFREIGRATASCPVKHWSDGRHVSGRPVCAAGLRQGARMLGGQSVVDIEESIHRPQGDPEHPWYIVKGSVVRLGI